MFRYKHTLKAIFPPDPNQYDVLIPAVPRIPAKIVECIRALAILLVTGLKTAYRLYILIFLYQLETYKVKVEEIFEEKPLTISNYCNNSFLFELLFIIHFKTNSVFLFMFNR